MIDHDERVQAELVRLRSDLTAKDALIAELRIALDLMIRRRDMQYDDWDNCLDSARKL